MWFWSQSVTVIESSPGDSLSAISQENWHIPKQTKLPQRLYFPQILLSAYIPFWTCTNLTRLNFITIFRWDSKAERNSENGILLPSLPQYSPPSHPKPSEVKRLSRGKICWNWNPSRCAHRHALDPTSTEQDSAEEWMVGPSFCKC